MTDKQQQVYDYLKENAGETNSNLVAQVFETKLSNMHKMLVTLEANGWMKVKRDKSGRRDYTKIKFLK